MNLLDFPRAVGQARPGQRIGGEDAGHAAGFAPDMRPDGGLALGPAQRKPVCARAADRSLWDKTMQFGARAGRPRFRPVVFPRLDYLDD